MSKFMLIDALHPEETRLVITDDGVIEEFDFITQSKTQIKSNLYLAKITRVEPSLQACFVEYGGDKQGFLPFSEIHPDYYQIPLADRMRILEEERRASEMEDEEEDGDFGDNLAEDGNASAEDGLDVADSEEDNQPRNRRRNRRNRRRFRGDRERTSHAQESNLEASNTDAIGDDIRGDVITSTTNVEVVAITTPATDTAAPSIDNENTVTTKAKTTSKRRSTKAAISEDTSELIEGTSAVDNTSDAVDAPKPRSKSRSAKTKIAEMTSDAMVISSDILDEEDYTPDNHAVNIAEDDSENANISDSDEPSTSESTREFNGNRRRQRRLRGRNRNRSRDNHSTQASEHTDGDTIDSVQDSESNDEIETISDDDQYEEQDNNHQSFRRRYKIQEVIKRGQIVLVQVIKEERGNKGVSLTTYISLPGRYCVLMPNSPKGGGISRKIARNEDRKRLRAIAAELRDSTGLSAIIRTAGIDRTKEEIQRDYEYLVKLWNQTRDAALSSTAPALVYEEGDIIKRSIRDYYNADIDNIIVQGEEAFHNAQSFMKLIMPSHTQRVKHYRDELPIFSAYDVESQLQAMHKPTARLKSGGYIVMDPTEALISIDVNSGRSTTERNVEETALKTNLEAAAQIARQLRLRDLGGLVVIDFIDMYHSKHRRMVERAFKDALKKDRAKIQVGHISPFGLLELSRQRLRPSISEATSSMCAHCNGSGRIRSKESLAIEIIREIEKDASTGHFAELVLTVTMDQALHLLNTSRAYLSKIEQRHGLKITVRTDNNSAAGVYSIEKIKLSPQARQERDRDRDKEKGRDHHNRHHVRHQHSQNDNAADESQLQPSEHTYSSDDTSNPDAQPQERSSRRKRGARGGRRRRFEREQNNTSFNNDDSSDEASDNSVDTLDNEAEITNVSTISSVHTPVTYIEENAHAVATSEIVTTPTHESSPAPILTVPVIEDVQPAVIIDESPKAKQSTRSGWWRKIIDA